MLNAAIAREFWIYDPETGEFRRRNYKKTGEAGPPITTELKSGYRMLKHKGKSYYAHRVAWLMVYGDWPDGEIDHVNSKRNDNRIINIRDVHIGYNVRQGRNISHGTKRINSSSKYKGVHRHKKGGWVASTFINGKSKYIGIRQSEREAHALYVRFYLEQGLPSPCKKCDVCI